MSRHGHVSIHFAHVIPLSLERLHQYLLIEQEPKPTEDGIPPAHWPSSGDLRVENLSARYSPVCLIVTFRYCDYPRRSFRMGRKFCIISLSMSSLGSALVSVSRR